jgi:menaquinone reductase, molybdopterin-binding-like subunit
MTGKMTMKVTRRNFIQLLVGGVAGLQLTPLPWKLTDDIAIWTQNWPWVPVPPTGPFSQTASLCTLCPGGCGIQVRKCGERAVKIEGRSDYPVNPGGICPIGMGGLQLLYNESIRFTGPARRVGQRGSGVYQPISWDEALSILTERISTLRKARRPQALAAVDGNPVQSTMAAMIDRFLTAAGSPNYIRVPSEEDTERASLKLMCGSTGGLGYDLENSDFILSFGCGLLEGWGSPGRVLNAWGMWHENPSGPHTKIVQVESRASNTASKADRWVAARPGTEMDLALGIAHVLIKENLYDDNFIHSRCHGFDEWTDSEGKEHPGFKGLVLEGFAPKTVEKTTGVPAGTIQEIALEFGKSRCPLALCGKGKGNYNGSVGDVIAVSALNALRGSVNRPGGFLALDPVPLSPLPSFNPDPVAKQGLASLRLDRRQTGDFTLTHSLPGAFAEAILNASVSPVDTLMVFASNPAFTLPDGGAFRRALEKIPFIVSFSPYRDETAIMADLVLPDHTYLEKADEVVQPRGLQYQLYGISKPVIEPVYGTKEAGDSLLETARILGGAFKEAFPWKNYQDVISFRAEGLFAASGAVFNFDGKTPPWKWGQNVKTRKPKNPAELVKRLRRGGVWYRPVENSSSPFATASGRFEFPGGVLEAAVKGRGAVKQGGKDGHPLVMIPVEFINLANGWAPHPPYLNKTLFDTQLSKDSSVVEIHPKTAAELRLKNGDEALLESPAGKAHVKVTLFEGAMPGVVYIPSGLGHTAYDEFVKNKGANPNELIVPGTDPVSGLPLWWNTPVKLRKA